MGKEEKWLPPAVVAEAHQDRDVEAPREMCAAHAPAPEALHHTPPPTGDRDSKPRWTGFIKWFFLCSVYGPMTVKSIRGESALQLIVEEPEPGALTWVPPGGADTGDEDHVAACKGVE
ncbi:hypothetical protein KUCAC02_006627 [Chaenocephalus aceratus]|uniref:Uncharacterized protein n=1 Tax=Chaenocephalus aceratus TaxID=36190 RepID=A0ACB9VT22_CHAAC|nr:hypothetical protein KUCAC02_006627 [Chaenocephalus aceratus]